MQNNAGNVHNLHINVSNCKKCMCLWRKKRKMCNARKMLKMYFRPFADYVDSDDEDPRHHHHPPIVHFDSDGGPPQVQDPGA